MVADATKDVSLVDLLDMDDMELESIDTTIASVAASTLMKETPTWFSTPKCSCPPCKWVFDTTNTYTTTLYKYIYSYSIPTPFQENET